MGKTQLTGNLTNAISQDASNNVGIGGSPSGTSTIVLNSNIGNTGAGQDPTRVLSSNMATGAGNRNMVRANATYFTA
jgi:hypothetical protein